MKWLRLITFFLMATAAAFANANPRMFPANSFQVRLEAVEDPYITVNGEVVPMSAGTLIFGRTNSTLVRGALQAGVWIRLQFDPQCNVRRIWILNEDEIVPPPVWSRWFQNEFDQPSCNGQ